MNKSKTSAITKEEQKSIHHSLNVAFASSIISLQKIPLLFPPMVSYLVKYTWRFSIEQIPFSLLIIAHVKRDHQGLTRWGRGIFQFQIFDEQKMEPKNDRTV